MPINEARRNVRDRWPLQFDLEAVPRDNAERARLLKEMRGLSAPPEEIMNTPQVTNNFTVDKLSAEQKQELLNLLLTDAPTGREIDLNKPVIVPYRHKEFPRMIYHHDSGHTLEIAAGPNADKELKAALKKGFQLKPAPGRDYSQVKRGIAPLASAATASDDGPPEVDFDETEDEAGDEENS
jgi:hypothetical protein